MIFLTPLWRSASTIKVLFTVVSLLAVGCTSIKPVTRLEYGYTRIQVPSMTSVSQYALVEQGIRVPISNVNVDFMVGPILAWDSFGGEETGINLTPSVFWFSSKTGISLLLELDVAIYPGEDYDNTSFLLFSATKEW